MADNSSSQKGIDIRKALEILAERTASSSSSHQHDSMAPTAPSTTQNQESGACGCHASSKDAPPNAANRGQTIDLNGVVPTNVTTTLSEEAASLQKRVQQERSQRQAELKERLQSMMVEDLLRTVLEAQEQRVLTYRAYDRGLEEVLQTANMTRYPSLCAEATASFFVLSETIKEVQAILLDKHQRKDTAKLVTQLQSKEKEKLNLTAALHLERIREQNATFKEGANVSNDTIVSLMKRDVVSLRQKIASCVEEINEILEEIRCRLIEEQE